MKFVLVHKLYTMPSCLFINTFFTFLSKQIKCWTFMWKNVTFTLAVAIFLCWIPIFMFDSGVEQEKIFVSLPEGDTLSFFPSGPDDILMYTPKTTFNNKLIECIRQKLQIIEERVLVLSNEVMIYHYFEEHRTYRDFAIIFEPVENSDKEIPMKLNYTIRTRNNNFRTSEIYANDVFDIAAKDVDEYIESGFLALQQSLDRCYLENVGIDLSLYEFKYQKFPFNARNAFFIGLEWIGLMLLMCTSCVLIIMVLIPLVEEKEKGIKEFLRIATKYIYLNNVALFLLAILVSMFLWVIVYILAGYYGFLGHVDVCSVFVLAVCYLLSMVSFTFMVSTMFPSVFYAKFGSILVFISSFLACLLNRDMTRWLMPFFSNAMVVDTFKMLDSYGKRGLTFKLLDNANDHFEDYYSLCETFGIFLIDTILYLATYYYFSYVFPGVFSTTRTFYFPFKSLFRCNKSGLKSISVSTEEELASSSSSSPDVAVRVRGLTKVFRSLFGRKNQIAVNQLSMDIPKNQITVLLGHNGAGKTTTMSMISGIISKTTGTISVNGEDDINRYRHMIGYCPQYNVLMCYFTVKDHLMFFAGLRGLNKSDAENQVKELLYKLHLIDNANKYVNDLSGGMKRRLCLGNAIIGNTQIAILDEPSSGLDPQSRRQLWNILLNLRKNHTILLTTHCMEEVETLADKIFFISYGEILFSGTSTQLKRKYSVGYTLKLLTNDDFAKDKTMELIKKYIPDAKIKVFVIPTLHVALPQNDFNKYETMLDNLEKHLVELGISSIGITNSSLEEVFLSCDQRIIPQSNDSTDSTSYFAMNSNDQKVGFRIKQRQCWAILYKKMIYMREMWCHWFLLFGCPIIALFTCFGIIHSSITNKTPTELIQLDLAHNNHPNVLVFMSHRDPLFHQRSLQEVVESYNSSVRLLGSSVRSVQHELLTIEKSNITYYNERVVCGIVIQFNKQLCSYLVNILYSGNFLHSLPVAVNLISNMILQSVSQDKYEIHINNYPLRRDRLSVSKSDLDAFVFLIPFAMFIYIMFYAVLPFNETLREFKKLQNMSLLLFWLTNYTIDLLIHIVFCGFIYVALNISDTHSIFEQEDYITLTTILLFYGIGYIPLLYAFGQSFTSMSSLFSFLSFFFLIFSVGFSFMSSSEDSMFKYDTCIHILLLFPDFALRHAMNIMVVQIGKRNSNFENYSRVAFLPEMSSYVDANPLNLKKVYIYFTVVAICGVMILLLIVENIYTKERIINFLKCGRCRKGDKTCFESTEEDEDVKQEQMVTELMVKGNLVRYYPIVVSNLRKCYGNTNVVNGINFTIKKGECFGLLGMNGAGKTTTFKMMTQYITMSNGEIYFNGIGHNKTKNQVNNIFGYCPQVDSLNDFMTSYESLKFMALLRGLEHDQINKEVNRLIEKTNLTKYANVRVSEYSGGTKRKLNTALAMITHPSIVFLDEPTTGVDPTARRLIWSYIQDFQKHNKTIVLTSHNMNECEYLCNRLAIMENGQIECIGSVQHLKNRFGKGFLLIVMVNRDTKPLDISKVKSYLTDSVDCNLREEYAGKLKYIVNNAKYEWSQVFRILHEFLITFTNVVCDISILETSLEDIFLKDEN